MAILSNVPTLSYCSWQNLIISYKEINYQILDSYTNKPYIFWDLSRPNELVASNKMLKTSDRLFYIIYNDKGVYTVVPNQGLSMSFGEGINRDLVTSKILGFGTGGGGSIDEQRFATLEMDVDGLKTQVGAVQEEMESTKQVVSEFEQRADSIEASVEEVEIIYNYTQELQELRENTNIALLDIQSILGIFNSDMNMFMEDNELSNDEFIQIGVYKEKLTEKQNNLNLQIDNVITFLTEEGNNENVERLSSQKNGFNTSISNLFEGIDNACTDNIFTDTDIISTISYFSKVNENINDINNMIDEFIFLESSGKIIKEVSELSLNQNEIKLSVSETNKLVTGEGGIEERLQTAEQTLTKEGISNLVKDTYYTKEEIEMQIASTVSSVKTLYYLSTSQDEIIGGEWSEEVPVWEDGKYVWSKTVSFYHDGSTQESDAVCLDGFTVFTWIMYADDEEGNGISNDPTGKKYIGFAYNKDTKVESLNPKEYTWSLFKGEDGQDGKDGASISILGSYNSFEELLNSHPNDNNKGDGYIVQGDLYIWNGTEFINTGKIQGEDGVSAYVHIRYSNDSGITFTPNNGEEPGDYIGIYNDNIKEDSNKTSDYKWTKIKGQDGIPGTKGEDGKTFYTWIRYSNNEDGSYMYNTPNSETKYIGIAVNKEEQTESNIASDYVWSLFKGDDGQNGRGLVSITPQYYLSTSKDEMIDGAWTEISPLWEKDKYLWIRHEIVYENPSSIEYTEPILDSGWEKINEVQKQVDENKIQVETINETISEHSVTINSISGKVEETEKSMTTINGEIVSLENRMQSAEQTLTKDGLTTIIGDSYTTEEMVDGILVSRNYATESKVTQTKEEIIQEFTSSGGYNLLYNGDFKNGIENWINDVKDGFWSASGLSCNNGIGACASGALDYTKALRQINIELDPNMTAYTLSFWQHTSTNGEDGTANPFRSIELAIGYTDGTWTYHTSGNQPNFNKWEKKIIQITKPENKSFKYANVSLYVRDTTRKIYFSQIMLEKGSVANEWTPNPNEIYDGIITANKDGIKVEMFEGEGSQGYSLVSSDGFSIYDSNGNRKAWFGQEDTSYIGHLTADDVTCNKIVKQDKNIPTTFYVNANPPSGSDYSGTSIANACDSINEMVARIKENYGEYIPWAEITIEVASGIYNEIVMIAGFMGAGQLTINLNASARVYGKWVIHDNTLPIYIFGNRSGGDINDGAQLFLTDDGHDAMFYVKNSYCYISYLRSMNKFYPNSNKVRYGNSFVFATTGAKVIMLACDISRYDYGMYCYRNSMGCIANCRGYVTYGGAARYGSHIGVAIAPSELDIPWYDWGGHVSKTNHETRPSLYDVNYETGSSSSNSTTPPTTASVTISQTFALTNLRTIPEGSGSATNARSGQIGQGKWKNYKAHRGYGNIPESLVAFCSGASNITMKIKMTRVSTPHGYDEEVPMPIFIYSGGSWNSNVAFARGQTKTITLPSSIVSEIAKGTMTRIHLWAGNSESNYSFYTNVNITVTCTKRL